MKKRNLLLLKDLCARLPYGVFVKYGNRSTPVKCDFECHPNLDDLENIKPYLRPLSSMTDEERIEWMEITHAQEWLIIGNLDKATDWLNEHMFDHRGLIPTGLALEAPKDMYKI